MMVNSNQARITARESILGAKASATRDSFSRVKDKVKVDRFTLAMIKIYVSDFHDFLILEI